MWIYAPLVTGQITEHFDRNYNILPNNYEICLPTKGQLFLKANCQVVDYPKKQMNEFAVFLT